MDSHSHSTQAPAPETQDLPTVPTVSTPATTLSPQAQESLTRQTDNHTHGQRYALLLSAEGLGHPLWSPSPRCTDTGAEYPINIGDVGIYSDMSPFHTLFNITKERGGIPDGHLQPKGVHEPCDIQGKVTVDPRYRRTWKLWTRPPGSLSQPDGNDSRVLKYKLSAKEGALLVLPQGGVSKRLQKTREFKNRISTYWRDWYEFAEEEGDLEEPKTLCLLTSVMQCRNWAMAVWDPDPRDDDTGSLLELTVDEHRGTCSWARPPLRCSAQSSEPASPASGRDIGEDGLELKETVFIKAFWINHSNVSFTTHSSQSLPPGQDEDRNHDEDPSRYRRYPRGPSDQSKGTPRPSNNPFRVNQRYNGLASGSPSLSQSLPSYYEDSGQSSNDWLASGAPFPDTGVVNTLNIVSLPAAFNTVSHPCQFINHLAFELALKVQPSLLHSGCVAFSHDEDWISVLGDFNGLRLPEGKAFLRLICNKYKFVAEKDVIYTELITPTEFEFIRDHTSIAPDEAELIPVLFQLREPEISYKYSQQTSEEIVHSTGSTRDSPDDDCRPGIHTSNHDGRDFTNHSHIGFHNSHGVRSTDTEPVNSHTGSESDPIPLEEEPSASAIAPVLVDTPKPQKKRDNDPFTTWLPLPHRRVYRSNYPISPVLRTGGIRAQKFFKPQQNFSIAGRSFANIQGDQQNYSVQNTGNVNVPINFYQGVNAVHSMGGRSYILPHQYQLRSVTDKMLCVIVVNRRRRRFGVTVKVYDVPKTRQESSEFLRNHAKFTTFSALHVLHHITNRKSLPSIHLDCGCFYSSFYMFVEID
ncbi:hypothetical protein AAF712_013016 [Marasmius tenuissimus]|uniref:Uncharacterized protein n=1 Tax=Marasmius tenuissimus TaxID=585030 RepID=A0ABR2ZGB2_9AGAR